MAIQSFQLDPNAASYTDDQIVGKVNAATAKVGADQVEDGTTNKVFTTTDETKLAGVAAGAEVNPADLAALDSVADTKLTGIEDNATADQDGDEMVTAINSGASAITREGALSQDDLNIVKTNPVAGEFKVKNIQRDTDGKLDTEYDDVAV